MARDRRKRTHSIAPVFLKYLIVSSLVWIVLLGVTLAITLRLSLSSLQSNIESTITATAASLAESEMVRQSLEEGACPPAVVAYIDDLVQNNESIDVISIADRDSVRLYHVVHERIGKTFVGGDEVQALQGESYLSDAVGTLGLQHRAFTPVRDANGSVVGFVMVSTTMDQLQELRSHIFSTYCKLAVAAFFAFLLVTLLLSRLIRKMLLGYGPEELIHTYLTQSDLLNNLDEGVVSIDERGDIQLSNRAAAKMLGKSPELLEGAALDDLLRTEAGESLLNQQGENVSTSRPNLLASVPQDTARQDGSAVLILKDKSDAMRQAEQLNGTRHIITALRANTHEFMNKLQVISGLLQMGHHQEALSYIGDISAVHAEATGPVLQHIHNPNVAALILGKLNNMRELGIRLTLLANSDLPERSDYLSTAELVTVVGNLLENAIEAVNDRREDGPRSIVLQITEDSGGLLILVSDTGTGIPPEVLPRIYEPGFSTKATEGRGVGMGLVRDIIARRGGAIEVDSDPAAGTSFTVICGERRKEL